MTSKTLLVLGASGRLGAAAAMAFAAAGWRVVTQSRGVCALPACAGQIQSVRMDLGDVRAVAEAAPGASVVLHAVNPPYERWAAEAFAAADQGMRIAELLGATFVLPGNVYNFGAAMPPVLDIDTAEQPSSRKGRIRVAIEAEMRRRGETSGLRSVVVRAGDFFGSGQGAWFDRVIVAKVASGRLVYPGPLHVPHAWAYVPDLARALVAVAAQAWPAPFTALNYSGLTLTGAELLAGVRAAAASLDLAPPGGFVQSSMPWRLIRLGAPFVPAWREIAEVEYLWRVPHRLDGSALGAALGPLPVTPLLDALTASLRQIGATHPSRQALEQHAA